MKATVLLNHNSCHKKEERKLKQRTGVFPLISRLKSSDLLEEQIIVSFLAEVQNRTPENAIS